MKKIIARHLTLLFIVFISLPAWSQPSFNDSIEVYNYWGKRGIIQVVYSYMQDYIATNPKASAEKRGMDAYFEKYIKEIDNISTTGIDNDFKDLNNFLSNNKWSTTAEKMVSPLKERLKRKQMLDSPFFSVFDAKGHKYMLEVQNIVTKYTQSVQEIQAKTPSAEPPKKPDKPVLPPESPHDKNLLNYLWLILTIILGFVIGGLLIYYYIKHKVLTILKSEKETSVEQDITLKQEISPLKSKNDEILNENIDLGKTSENLRLEETSGHNETKSLNESPNIEKTLFYTIPETDGTFKTENARDFKEQDTFYKVELISNTNGNISFISGDFDLRAIQNIDYYLIPVCEVQNLANIAFVKKVVMINHGSVVLKGDSWQINDKIKIKLV